jgi:sugar phosphate isomerase/epimerase
MIPAPRRISLDHATTPGLNPMQTIALAHELGCDAVSLRLRAHPSYPHNPYDLIGDPVERRRIRDDVAARGMFVAVISGFEINPGDRIAVMQPALDAAADLGARGLSVVVYDRDPASHPNRVGELADRSGKLGVRTLLEYFAMSGVDSLPYALDLIAGIGNPTLGISADSLHFTRTGTTAAQLAAVPVGLIGHAQVNDGPWLLPADKQLDEARGNRLLPGEGEFDLVGFLRALPPDVTIGVEAGSRLRFAQGVTMAEHGRAAIAATRRIVRKAFPL